MKPERKYSSSLKRPADKKQADTAVPTGSFRNRTVLCYKRVPRCLYVSSEHTCVRLITVPPDSGCDSVAWWTIWRHFRHFCCQHTLSRNRRVFRTCLRWTRTLTVTRLILSFRNGGVGAKHTHATCTLGRNALIKMEPPGLSSFRARITTQQVLPCLR